MESFLFTLSYDQMLGPQQLPIGSGSFRQQAVNFVEKGVEARLQLGSHSEEAEGHGHRLGANPF